MACFGANLENDFINWLLRGQTMNYGGTATGYGTASTHVGLFTDLPVGGSGGTEVSGGSYARVEVASTTGNWVAPSNGETYNAIPIRFPRPTDDWGDIIGVGVWSSASGGTLLLHGSWAPAKPVMDNQSPPVFVPGALILRVDAI
jgi:hypothetical protein